MNKKVVETQGTMVMAIIIATSNVLNSSVFFSMIDQVIWNNLQLQ